mmetsp:Transcript_20932/g.34563  ORF Transcript_20932/g.34563 Transcript_20932/m.34563 type:complete len:214 (+) Transcript_20932:327-968(+)
MKASAAKACAARSESREAVLSHKDRPSVMFLRCSRSNSKTGYAGVTKRKRGDQTVFIAHVPQAANGADKPVYVGTFQTADDAACAIVRELGPEKADAATREPAAGAAPFADIHALSKADAESMAAAKGLHRRSSKIFTSVYKNVVQEKRSGKYWAIAHEKTSTIDAMTGKTCKKYITKKLGLFNCMSELATQPLPAECEGANAIEAVAFLNTC